MSISLIKEKQHFHFPCLRAEDMRQTCVDDSYRVLMMVGTNGNLCSDFPPCNFASLLWIWLERSNTTKEKATCLFFYCHLLYIICTSPRHWQFPSILAHNLFRVCIPFFLLPPENVSSPPSCLFFHILSTPDPLIPPSQRRNCEFPRRSFCVSFQW